MPETSLLDLFPATQNASGASLSQHTGRYRTTQNKRINAMTDITTGLEKAEQPALHKFVCGRGSKKGAQT
jgi:hypothetical protein